MKISNIRIFAPVILLGMSLVFVGCENNSSSSNENIESTEIKDVPNTHTPETFLKEIESLEKAVANPNLPNHDIVALQLVEYYQTYAQLFGNNELAPEMLFRGGNQAVNIQDYNMAITLYAQIESHYSTFQKRPEAIFLQGFVFESYLNEFGKAQEKYEKLIKQYPDHILALQAEESIKYLGISDEERIRQFEKNSESNN